MVRTPRCAVHGLLCGPLPRPRSRVMMRGATGMRDGVVAHDRQSTVGADCVGHFPRVSSWDGLVVGGFPRVAGASPLRGGERAAAAGVGACRISGAGGG